MLWLRPIEAAVQGEGAEGSATSRHMLPSSSGVTRPRPSRVRWMNIPSRFISSVCFVISIGLVLDHALFLDRCLNCC